MTAGNTPAKCHVCSKLVIDCPGHPEPTKCNQCNKTVWNCEGHPR